MRLAGTGHRPDKLGGYGQEAVDNWVSIAELHLQALAPDEVISGLALGWDTYLAMAAQRLGIPVIGAMPFAGQESKWPAASQAVYHDIVSKCANIVVVCDGGYHPGKMQKRNEWMVRESDFLLACWDGSSGGTGNCVEFARRYYGKLFGQYFYNCYEVSHA